jgi:hypothetical protein
VSPTPCASPDPLCPQPSWSAKADHPRICTRDDSTLPSTISGIKTSDVNIVTNPPNGVLIKTWLRAWKVRLILEENPDWWDLYEEVGWG